MPDPDSSRPHGRALVITVSDRCFAGTAADSSGPAVVRLLSEAGFEVGEAIVVPDDQALIVQNLEQAAAAGFDVVMTTGGTGLARRDLTPQATASVIDHEVPGLTEHMRRLGTESTPMAMLSRALAGVRERTLIVNLPGSERGATESLRSIIPVLEHAVRLLRGDTAH